MAVFRIEKTRDYTVMSNHHFGMGLYICKVLCEKHGGSLLLENHKNGAQATVFFRF